MRSMKRERREGLIVAGDLRIGGGFFAAGSQENARGAARRAEVDR
jgi:hypothetical protein